MLKKLEKTFLPLLISPIVFFIPQNTNAHDLTSNITNYSWKTFRNGFFNNGLTSIKIKDKKSNSKLKSFSTKGLICY